MELITTGLTEKPVLTLTSVGVGIGEVILKGSLL